MEHKLLVTRLVNGMYRDRQELTYLLELPFQPFLKMCIKFADIDPYDLGVFGVITVDHLTWDLDKHMWLCSDDDASYNYTEKYMQMFKERVQLLQDYGWKLRNGH